MALQEHHGATFATAVLGTYVQQDRQCPPPCSSWDQRSHLHLRFPPPPLPPASSLFCSARGFCRSQCPSAAVIK
jgi:hypothetical protein